MKVHGVETRTIGVADDGFTVEVIDQTRLPFEFTTVALKTVDDAARAIREMQVRGAPLIGVTAAYGLCLQARLDPSDAGLDAAYADLIATRPTAVNLRWALDRMLLKLRPVPISERVDAAYAAAAELAEEDVATCRAIGDHGLPLIAAAESFARDRGRDVIGLLTHCNAGWLATVDWGTALAPVYRAQDEGLPIHVWVDETRPRNQGASLTAWELAQHGVPHTVIADNTGGHLMQKGLVDLCITGSDRTAANGDVCNKIGTYLKALAAYDNGIPFYVALPCSTIDWEIADGCAEIPIEERDGQEMSRVAGMDESGKVTRVQVVASESAVANYAFDVTPARLVTSLITECGVFSTSVSGMRELYAARTREE
ncbi:S-methyl-5-thioribose-1-phosphate isomerase [Myxococcota bacterium]|nr:S-methyl-5-thioribose-1-phosphate isomerase [Myxococcota bacterium]